MRPIDYETLINELLEHYPIEENPEIYSLYTPMRLFLIKVFHLKNSTAIKLLLKIEEKMGIHLVRDREVTNMQMLKLKKNEDVKRYFRTIYWYSKLKLETVDAIIKKYGDINKRLVKEYLHKNGQMNDKKFNEFNYAQLYYKEHKEAIKEKKRLYRQKKRLEKDK